MFLHRRFIHTWTAVPKCNENYFTTEKLLPWTKIPYFCLIHPVLGQWLMFSQSPYLSFGLFSQFCTYMIFLPVIVKYSNTNLHMHIEPPKNILYNVILLVHLFKLDFYLISSCVPICVIFRWLTYKCSRLLMHYTRFIMFLHRRFIHTCPAVPKCNDNYFTTEKPLPWTKHPYTCLIYPVLGQWLMFNQSPYLSFGLFSQFCVCMIFGPVIEIPTSTCT